MRGVEEDGHQEASRGVIKPASRSSSRPLRFLKTEITGTSVSSTSRHTRVHNITRENLNNDAKPSSEPEAQREEKFSGAISFSIFCQIFFFTFWFFLEEP